MVQGKLDNHRQKQLLHDIKKSTNQIKDQNLRRKIIKLFKMGEKLNNIGSPRGLLDITEKKGKFALKAIVCIKALIDISL